MELKDFLKLNQDGLNEARGGEGEGELSSGGKAMTLNQEMMRQAVVIAGGSNHTLSIEILTAELNARMNKPNMRTCAICGQPFPDNDKGDGFCAPCVLD